MKSAEFSGAAVAAQALDSDDVRALDLNCKGETSTSAPPVDEDGAGPAHAVIAARVGTDEPERIAEKVDERGARFHLPGDGFTVDGAIDLVAAQAEPRARAAAVTTARPARVRIAWDR